VIFGAGNICSRLGYKTVCWVEYSKHRSVCNTAGASLRSLLRSSSSLLVALVFLSMRLLRTANVTKDSLHFSISTVQTYASPSMRDLGYTGQTRQLFPDLKLLFRCRSYVWHPGFGLWRACKHSSSGRRSRPDACAALAWLGQGRKTQETSPGLACLTLPYPYAEL
jgi:hypothetical protein